MTFGGGADPVDLNGILADLDQGYSSSVAFVVPKGASWPLPLYELALMTPRRSTAWAWTASLCTS